MRILNYLSININLSIMNKRFFTFAAGLFLAGSLSVASAQGNHNGLGTVAGAEIPYRTQLTQSDVFDVANNDYGVKTIEAGKWYQLEVGTHGTPVSATPDSDAKVLVQVRDYNTGELTLKVVSQKNLSTGTATPATNEWVGADASGNYSLNASLWKIEVVSKHQGAYMFKFTNKETGYELSYNCPDAVNLTAVADLTNQSRGPKVNAASATINKSGMNAWRWYTTDNNATTVFGAAKLYTFNHNNEKVLGLAAKADGDVVLVDIPASLVVGNQGNQMIAAYKVLNFTVRNAGSRVLNAADLNTMIDADNSWKNRTNSLGAAFAEAAGFSNNNLFSGKYIAIDTQNSDYLNTNPTKDYAGYSIVLRKGDKYFMVATDKTYESDKLPSEHGGLVVEDAKYEETGVTSAVYEAPITALKARYHWKVTYYPTPDSLVFEPLNASFIGTEDKKAGLKWADTPLAAATDVDFYNTVNAGVAHVDGAAATVAGTNVPFNKPALVPVALTLMNYTGAIDNKSVLTVGQSKNTAGVTPRTDKYGRPLLTDVVAQMGVKIQFKHKYSYLTRTSLEDGLYYINLSVEDDSKRTDYRKNGMNLVYNMWGQLMYDRKDDYQNYDHMPATQWIIERDTCFDAATPYVTIKNREYADGILFHGQLYDAGKGKYYIINHQVYDHVALSSGKFNSNTLSCADTLTFTQITDKAIIEDQFIGYKHFDFENLKYEAWSIKYLTADTYGVPTTDKYLNVNEKDGYLNVNTNEWRNFEVDSLFEAVPFGNKGAGTKQLYRTVYTLKVKDNNLIDNGWKYVVVKEDGNGNSYYQMAHLKDVDGRNVKLGTFYFKADQITKDGDPAYVLVDATTWSTTANLKKEAWVTTDATKPYNENQPKLAELYRDIKAGDIFHAYMPIPYKYKDNGYKRLDVKDQTTKISFMTLDTDPMDRTSAFVFVNDPRPLYMPIGADVRDLNGNVNIYAKRGSAKEYLFEDGNNGNSAQIAEGTYVKGFGYLGQTAEGVKPVGASKTTALYVDSVINSKFRMPQYLLAVAVDSVKDGRWCNTNEHGYFPSEKAADEEDATHHVFYNGYVAGRFLVNLNDSIKTDGHGMLENGAKYTFRNLVRLGFVEGIHMNVTKAEAASKDNAFGFGEGEYLFILKNNITLEDLKSKWSDGEGHNVVNPTALNKAIKDGKVLVNKLDGAHKNYAFSFRYTDDEHKNVLLESQGLGKKAFIGCFSEASWVQILDGTPVLTQSETINGDHTSIDGNDNLKGLIAQAQIYNVEKTDKIATDNEEINTTSVVITAVDGGVKVTNATGKKVAISNILGQTVANTTLKSDDASIPVSAGIVVVAVEGEDAVKVIVR